MDHVILAFAAFGLIVVCCFLVVGVVLAIGQYQRNRREDPS